MHQLANYEVYIFDCDGVILDSNKLKIEAMKNTLEANFSSKRLIDECIEYFSHNFGKSRFHHVAHFLDSILKPRKENKSQLELIILEEFSKHCRTLYMSAKLTPGFMEFLVQCDGKRYVASGSEQNELREVFVKRGLNKYFNGSTNSNFYIEVLLSNS